ncbi:hypothetical protein NSMS1_44070 [Nostoc sp. MS1]|nr:hypothetical protein NSMS1_44070 [Nostoc sp. MS1]
MLNFGKLLLLTNPDKILLRPEYLIYTLMRLQEIIPSPANHTNLKKNATNILGGGARPCTPTNNEVLQRFFESVLLVNMFALVDKCFSEPDTRNPFLSLFTL